MPVGPRPAWPVGVARVAVSGTTFGHRWVNVFYLQLAHTGTVTVNDLKTLADYIGANYFTNSSSIANTTLLTAVDVSFIPATGQVTRFTGSYSTGGAATGAQIADASACIVLDWVIPDRYRGGHPRTYLPGLLAADVSNGSLISATRVSTLVANANLFRNNVNALTTTNITAVTMGTVRFQSAGAWLTPPVFRAYTSVNGRGTLGSQRRRITS